MKTFTEKIKLYEGFIRDKKISNLSIPSYQKEIEKSKKIIDLLKRNRMTPQVFSEFNSRDRWDISKELKSIIWCCENCNAEITKSRPERAFMDGEEIHCINCDYPLTKRTNGGQSDPFNYTFKNL